jgi:hypothetical protein
MILPWIGKMDGLADIKQQAKRKEYADWIRGDAVDAPVKG